jgi:hypothetical protein
MQKVSKIYLAYIIHLDLKLIESIQIKFLNEEAEEISRHIIRSLTGKFSFTVEKGGNYKVCAQSLVSYWMDNRKIFMKIKIESDATEEFNLQNAVKKEDVNPIANKINQIIRKAEKIIQKQHKETQNEEEYYNLQQKYSKLFISLTVIQILIVLVIGFYHLYSFRNFLLTNKVI